VLDAAVTSDLEDERRQAAERAARGAELAERAIDDFEAAPGDQSPAPGSISITLEKEIDLQPVPRYAERVEIEMATEMK
jgi:hypothetical protein